MCCWVSADFVRAAGSGCFGSSFRDFKSLARGSVEIPLLQDLVR